MCFRRMKCRESLRIGLFQHIDLRGPIVNEYSAVEEFLEILLLLLLVDLLVEYGKELLT